MAKVNIENFKLMSLLDERPDGTVYLAKKIGGVDHERSYALKILNKPTYTTKNKYKYESIRSERKILELIGTTPFLLKMFYAFQTDVHFFFALEYISGGSLYDLLVKGEFSERQTQFYTAELVLAVEHLHSLNVIHRDIKLDHILLDAEGHIVLIDFGTATLRSNLRDQCGTPIYHAPERLIGRYGFAVDWWAVGVVCFEMVTGYSPFFKDTEDQIRDSILNDDPTDDNFSDKPSKSIDFLRKMLIKDPTRRLGSETVEDIKYHPFFRHVDWSCLAKKQILVPLKCTESPVITIKCASLGESFKAAASKTRSLRGFSYVAPDLLKDNLQRSAMEVEDMITEIDQSVEMSEAEPESSENATADCKCRW